MKVEGIKRSHLVFSSAFYVFIILDGIFVVGREWDFTPFQTSIRIFSFISSLSLPLIGFLLLFYYSSKKEELVAKIVCVLNIFFSLIYLYTILGINGFNGFAIPVIGMAAITIILPVILLLFNIYLYWSREKPETVKREPKK